MDHILQTGRLRLREFTFNDTDFVITLLNSPGWLKFIGDRHVNTEAGARAYLENGAMKSYRENGFGLSLVELKEGNVPIGMCGLIKRGNLDHPDIGFAFLPQYCKKGFGFEITSALLNHAFDKLYMNTILGITVHENKNSISLLEKLGMRYTKTIRSENGAEDLLLYAICKRP